MILQQGFLASRCVYTTTSGAIDPENSHLKYRRLSMKCVHYEQPKNLLRSASTIACTGCDQVCHRVCIKSNQRNLLCDNCLHIKKQCPLNSETTGFVSLRYFFGRCLENSRSGVHPCYPVIDVYAFL